MILPGFPAVCRNPAAYGAGRTGGFAVIRHDLHGGLPLDEAPRHPVYCRLTFPQRSIRPCTFFSSSAFPLNGVAQNNENNAYSANTKLLLPLQKPVGFSVFPVHLRSLAYPRRWRKNLPILRCNAAKSTGFAKWPWQYDCY